MTPGWSLPVSSKRIDSGTSTCVNPWCTRSAYSDGRPSRAGDYAPADEAWSRLLDKLGRRDFTGAGPELRRAILAFYATYDADPEVEVETRRTDPSRWRRNRRDLDRLRALSP